MSSTGTILTLAKLTPLATSWPPNFAELQNFFGAQAPLLINAIIGAFTLSVFVFSLASRQRSLLVRLGIVGLMWFLNGLRYWHVTDIATSRVMREYAVGTGLMALFSLVLFGYAYFNRKQQRLQVWMTAALAAAGIAVEAGLPGQRLSELPLVLAMLLMAIAAAALFTHEVMESRKGEAIMMAVVVATAFAAAVHDFGCLPPGLRLGFDIMPLAGLVVVGAFGFAMGDRVLNALAAVEDINQMLENRVRAASAGLAASEAARRALEVSGAITQERERLMREIHDGIGSSLVTTIAASERQGPKVDSVSILKRALTDLRIAVDSLEPVQGDLATLMASLRYRVEPELRNAGIGFDWQVEEVPQLNWLDPVNALHILRIFQETFSNIAGHAQATRITVRCLAETRADREGVLIEVVDNGIGFDQSLKRSGHGLKNMMNRAGALDGVYSNSSIAGRGTTVSLWLPLSKNDERY